MMKRHTRREFIQRISLLVPAAVFTTMAPACTKSGEINAESGAAGDAAPDLPEGVKPAKPGQGTAKALNYVHDAAKAPATLRPADSTHLCSNCQHYSQYDNTEWGKCAVIPEGAVKADGWCTAWVQKQA